jgi:hypothetical protein
MIFHLKLAPEFKHNLRLCVENQGSNFLDLSPAGLDVSEEQAIGMRADILWRMKRGHMTVAVSDGPGEELTKLSLDEYEDFTKAEEKDREVMKAFRDPLPPAPLVEDDEPPV